MTECPRCGTVLPDEASTSIQPMECPACGKSVGPSPVWETSLSIVRNYFRDLWHILIHPVLFFRHMPIRGGLGRPLAFALVTHWLGAAIAFLWGSLFGGLTSHVMRIFFQFAGDMADDNSFGQSSQLIEMRDRIIQWFFGAGAVLLDPFLTLMSILMTSFLVYIGARILISPGKAGHREEITYESALRVICFGMTPAILASLPMIGGFVASIWILVATVVGAREVYRIQTPRAVVVALFPKLFFLGILGMGLFLFIFTLIKLFAF